MPAQLSNLPPGPSGLPFLRRLPQIQRDTLGFLLDMAHTYGDLAFFDVPNNPAFFLNSPEHIQHVLQEKNASYSKNTVQYNALSKITGKGLLTSEGPLWLRQRRLEQPAFSRQRLAALDGVIVPAVEAMLKRWELLAGTDEPLDVDREMMNVALEIVGKALFSIDLSQSAKKLTDAVLIVLDHIVYQVRHPIQMLDFLITPRKARFYAALSTLDLAVYDMIAARRESDSGDDLLGMLLRARDETGQPMSDQQVRDELITILIAGHETVASALTWSWYLLAQHPAAWEQLRAEVQSVLGERTPTTADLGALAYTGQVFSEALRLYPPAWVITRKAVEPDQYGPYLVPAGALAIISPYVIHRHPAYWSDPEAFQPERFAAGCTIPRYAYIPFGGGPRLCIGNTFATIEAQMVLAMVTQRFRLELIPHRSVVVDALVTLRPRHGLPMHVRKA
jgi:cytochrome P450